MPQGTSLFRRIVLGFSAATLLCVTVLAAPALAQSTGGSLLGTITDDQGGVLPGVTVSARNTETGLTRTTVTGADGQYQLLALPPGRYDLSAELAGFQTTNVAN